MKVEYYDPDADEDVAGELVLKGRSARFTWHDDRISYGVIQDADTDGAWIEWDDSMSDELSMEDILDSHFRNREAS